MKSILLCTALAAAALTLGLGTTPAVSPGAVTPVTHYRDSVEFPATVNASGFGRHVLGMPGYHLIVWKGGRASGEALFQTAVTDVQILDALEALGAKPGNNLPMETWDDRKDPKSKAPDMIIAGPAIDVLVRVPGRAEPLTLDQILTGQQGIAMRLGGHRANIPKWKSGCIACLYSCPGSKVGNAKATVRDYVRDPDRYQVRPGVLPADGTGVRVVLRLAGGQTPQKPHG